MAKPEPRRTLKQHIESILEIVPAGVRISFELRTSYDKTTGDYIVGERGYSYGESMLLRFSITKPPKAAPAASPQQPKPLESKDANDNHSL